MSRKQIFIVITIIALILMLTVLHFYRRYNNQKIIKEDDLDTIISLSLEKILDNNYLPFEIFKKQNYNPIIILNENFSKTKSFSIKQYNFEVLSIGSIHERTASVGDFLYIVVKEISIRGSKGTIIMENISTDNNIQVGGFIKFSINKNDDILLNVEDGGVY